LVACMTRVVADLRIECFELVHRVLRSQVQVLIRFSAQHSS